MTLNELKQQRDAAYTVLQDISRERNTRRDEMISAARRIIDADIAALYGDRLDAAQEAYTIAYRAHLAALEAHALTGAGCPVPLGTKLVKWEIPGNMYLTTIEFLGHNRLWSGLPASGRMAGCSVVANFSGFFLRLATREAK